MYLAVKLPRYMIPYNFIQIGKIPINANGKIDRKALQQIQNTQITNYAAPETEKQKIMCGIWERLLNISKIGIDDNFFEIGGDSLIAIKLQIEAMGHGMNITYADIFSYPTVRELTSVTKKKIENANILDYDFSKIDELLRKNIKENIIVDSKSNIGNLLLFGGTGYLGAHILAEFLENENGVVYCIVRNKEREKWSKRVKKANEFYFGDKYKNIWYKRVKVVQGDITRKFFGMEQHEYEELGQKIDTVINAAALVKHYGKKDVFKTTNIDGTDNIVEFCKTFGKKLVHCSTMSISGELTNEEKTPQKLKTFTEQDFYFGQNLENVYIQTKFEAEKIIYEEINKGLNACCVRLGNISSRYNDGVFQKNISENAFLNRLKSFIQIGMIPDIVLKHFVEISPVDLIANAIVKIAKYNDKYTTFHLYNSKTIQIEKLLKMLKQNGIEIQAVTEEKFAERISKINKNKEQKQILSGIINDLTKDKKLNYMLNVKFSGEFTEQYLKKLGFEWKELDETYFMKFIGYLKKVGYLGGV